MFKSFMYLVAPNTTSGGFVSVINDYTLLDTMIFKIDSSVNLNEIGKYPQTIPVRAFHKKAKRTDYIGCASDSEK